MRELDLSLTDAEGALDHIDPHDRDTWLRMGMALKAEYGEGGFEAWDRWSAQASNYNERECRQAWKSLKDTGGVSIGSLIYAAKQAGWTPPERELSREERERREREQAERQRERRERAREEAARQAAWHERIAALAARCRDEVLSTTGRAPYLGQKKVRGFGVRFVRRGALLIVDEQAETTRLITGREAVSEWFASGERNAESISFRYLKAGTVAVPMHDVGGKLWGWQFIFQGGAKKFLRHGRKRGLFHLIGECPSRARLAIAEGYATGATIHEATGWPVAVVFDAGNIAPVAAELRQAYPDMEFVFCGDDDHETTDASGNPVNAGREKAGRAAGEFGGITAFPQFEEPAGRTDWNDLQAEQGIAAVQRQLMAAVARGGDGAEQPVTNAYRLPSDAPPDDEEPPPPDPDDPVYTPGSPSASESWDWMDRLNRTEKGGIKSTLHNIVMILENDPRWTGLFRMDEFANEIQRTRKAPYGKASGTVEDVDGGEVACWISDPLTYGVPTASKLALEALEIVAARRKFHPVREYLDSLRWDGEPRLDHMFADHFGAVFDEYTAAVGANWLMSAVARVRNPGCKVDFMVILEGGQGRGKSTAVRTLCGAQWFAETQESPQSKDFFQVLTGRWIVEIPELQGFNKADRNRIKAVLSSQEDTYRPSYGRYARQFPRQTVIVGTTNDDGYLRDETGARRFLPVRVGSIDLSALADLRDQLWAEADYRYQQGERYWEFPEQAKAEQDARYDADAWEEPIGNWLAGLCNTDQYPAHYPYIDEDRPVEKTTVFDVMTYALKIDMGKQSKPDQMRVAAALKRLGFKRGPQKMTPDGRRPNIYVRDTG